jgi:endonuclease YncB( thermonuclease family)
MAVKAAQKAPLCGAFLFIILSALALFSPSTVAADCRPCSGSLHEVERVIDGDTLHLKIGTKLRLIGINTPELGGWSKPHQTGAKAAKSALQALIAQNDGKVSVCPGVEREDRYGRKLVHLAGLDGQNITAKLLREGMGWAIAVPPNVRYLDCYLAAESLARADKLGVWRHSPIAAASLNGDERGFHHVYGRIIRVGESRSALWLNLQGGLALRITWKDWRAFNIDDPEQLVDQPLEARGWLYQRNREQRLRIRHPSSIRWLKAALD